MPSTWTLTRWQLAMWLDAARAAGQPMPEAMTIASATSDAVPSARLVVLRGPDGLTTGSATAGEAATGSPSGCRRNDPAAEDPPN
jgi:pyridoxine/pyridoxamine 5'-phosphate oxidase